MGELRVSCIEQNDGSIRILPAIEFFVNTDRKIRLPTDKLVTNEDGNATGYAKNYSQIGAELKEDFEQELHKNIRKAHKALGCRDFSIYDIRVDPKGNMYFLEASLYCSFAPRSAIVLMSSGTEDIDHQQLYRRVLSNVAKRGRRQAEESKNDSCSQRKSMKGKVLPSSTKKKDISLSSSLHKVRQQPKAIFSH